MTSETSENTIFVRFYFTLSNANLVYVAEEQSLVPLETTDDMAPTVRTAFLSFNTRRKLQQEEKSTVTWGGTTQYTRTEDGVREHDDGDVFTVNHDSTQFPPTKHRASHKLKDSGSKGKRFRYVVETVRALRRDKTTAPESTLDANKTPETKASSKPRIKSSFRKKFASLKERRQRSVSESNLGSMFRSRDDMDLWLREQNRAAAICDKNGAKNLPRRSSEDLTGVITLDRNRNPQKYCISLPNSPVTTQIERSLVGARHSSDHSTASCSSNSRGSSITQSGDSKSATCNFDVLILSECNDCKDPRQQFNSI